MARQYKLARKMKKIALTAAAKELGVSQPTLGSQCVYAFGRFSNTFDRQVCGDQNASAVSPGVPFHDRFRTGTRIS